MKTLTNEEGTCEELTALQSELDLPPLNTDLWISIPRVFSRSNARFELPPFSDMLKGKLDILSDKIGVELYDLGGHFCPLLEKIIFEFWFKKYCFPCSVAKRVFLMKPYMFYA